jgi:ATP/maltotriose-dependent transcriptional regulator MalT
MFAGDAATAYPIFVQAAERGDRFREPNLATLARLGQGQCLIMLDRVAEGVVLLDEAMVAVAAGEVSPIPAGLAYCIMIDACQEIFDVRRAQEWTSALTRWCARQPDLVPYRGQCLVHRAEIKQLHGDWPHAMEEAQQACDRLAEQPAVGMAFYARAEIHRLRGESEQAEEAYRRAGEAGRMPQPGLALLRLAQGQVAAAAAAIRRSLDEAEIHGATRAKLLPACVEIMLAAGDVSAARTANDELSEISALLDVAFVRGLSAHATGAVLLAEGDARSALAALRDASTLWRDLDVPYEAARVRVLVALARRELGDDDTADMELDAARRAFEELGATPELKRLKGFFGKAVPRSAGGLTDREVEVLRLVASGKTNRAIATELVLSEKTVARHVSNIFTKLGLASRSAATAYAYEQGLV